MQEPKANSRANKFPAKAAASGQREWPSQVGLVIGLIGAAWWLLAGISITAGFSEKMNFVDILVHGALLSLVFIIGVAVAWRQASFGGVLLVVVGLIVAVSSPIIAYHCNEISDGQVTIVSVLLTGSLPLLASGALFLLSQRQHTRDSVVNEERTA